MITQELIAYVKSELNKGRTREEIRSSLLSGGGWTDSDIGEVWRTVMPVAATVAPTPTPAASPAPAAVANPVVNKTPGMINPAIVVPKEPPVISFLNRQQPITPPATISPALTPAPTPAPAPIITAPKITPNITPPISAPIVHPVEPPKIEKIFEPQKVNKIEKAEKKPSNIAWAPIILSIIFLAICFVAFYFYRPQLAMLKDKTAVFFSSIPGSLRGLLPEKSEPVPTQVEQTPEQPAAPIVKATVNCGATSPVDRKNTTLNDKNVVLKCLGENAAVCASATGKINDPLFPTNIKITNTAGNCRFELSYDATSTLIDVNGKSLALRSMSCPLSVVRSIDETNPSKPVFKVAATTNPSKYMMDIYTYGTLGIFIENNFDQKKIEALGCNGDFIKSVIESYNLAKSKN